MENKESLSYQNEIARLNDALRRHGQGGMVMMTNDVLRLGENSAHRIAQAVRNFDDFTKDNDPYGEHDFGSVTVDGIKCLWKIDYFDLDLMYHSPDKSDPNVTRRVLTIMLANEY